MIVATTQKTLTAGFVITDGVSIIGCLPTGNFDDRCQYDLPKGHVERSEDVLEGALRELREETGIVLSDFSSLQDLGEFSYTKRKNLHLFLYAMRDLPALSSLFCYSYFDSQSGRQLPEMQGYKYIPIRDLTWFTPQLATVLVGMRDRGMFSNLLQ